MKIVKIPHRLIWFNTDLHMEASLFLKIQFSWQPRKFIQKIYSEKGGPLCEKKNVLSI